MDGVSCLYGFDLGMGGTGWDGSTIMNALL